MSSHLQGSFCQLLTSSADKVLLDLQQLPYQRPLAAFPTPTPYTLSQLLLVCYTGAAEARGDRHVACQQREHVWAAHWRAAGSVRKAEVG